MEFYFPSKSKVRYEIIFDWGEYIIITEDKQGSDVHENSKPYLGYITFRPKVTKQDSKDKYSFYLITPDGEVWENKTGFGIAEAGNRQEVTKEKTKFGTSTKTLTIQSESEPVIDHFKAHPDKWTRFGKLERLGDKTKLILVD